MNNTMKTRSPWAWVPSLYFAEGLPYVAVMIISLVMYKRMGISNTEVALYTSWLNLPWVIKPLWSPFIDIIKTKRYWITSMQLLIGAGLAGIAFTIPTDLFLQSTLAIFWLMAVSSATHDIAADGFYMIGLTQHEQALFVGIRSTFYRLATITGQGGLIMLAGYLESSGGNISRAWSITFYILSGLFIGLWLYHRYILPHPSSDINVGNNTSKSIMSSFVGTFRSFFKKEQAATAILFMLLYRLPEALLAKMSIPFLLDPLEKGGLAMTTEQIGFTQGTVGVIGLTIGGILGGIAVSRHGLKKWLWPMVWAISLPDLVYVYLKLFPTQQSDGNKHVCVHRTVRLRFRIYCLYVISDLLFARGKQNSALCHLYRIHGIGHDASRNDGRMVAGNYGIPYVFYMDNGMYCRHFLGYIIA